VMLLLDANPLLSAAMMAISVLLIPAIAKLDALMNKLNAMTITLVPMTPVILQLDVFLLQPTVMIMMHVL